MIVEYELELVKNGIEDGILKESYLDDYEQKRIENLKEIQRLKEELEDLEIYNKEIEMVMAGIEEL